MNEFDPVGGSDFIFNLTNFFSNLFAEGGFVANLTMILKGLSYILIPFFLVASIALLIKAWRYRPEIKVTYSPATVPQEKLARQRWEDLMGRFEASLDSDASLFVLEADSMVDDILKRIGIPGDTMMERITNLEPVEISSIPDLAAAHRIRNNIAHTPGFKVSKPEAANLLKKYKRVLEELEVL
ncbi:hypothetical protein HYW53_02650 [Candidatus Giovannonibacteria bacterium]|nr:hypothetical protein [Candidatus Giovannonibacteria bacterium]